jgi:outer membrane protein TolC
MSGTRFVPFAFAFLVAIPALAQGPAPVSLSLQDAVRRARGATPVAELSQLQVEESRARLGVLRASLLPSLSGSISGVNQTLNTRTFGIDFPSIPGQNPLPELAGPFGVVDARARLSQTVLDLGGLARVNAAKSDVERHEAEGDATADATAHAAAAAYVEAARAQAVATARQADVEIATELRSLAEAQTEAGIGTAIDVARARTEEAAAKGELALAQNRLERQLLALERVTGIAPGTKLALTDTLGVTLGEADAPADPDAATRLALSRRPDLRAETARGLLAAREHRAILAERLPRIDAIANYGMTGRGVSDMIATGQVGVQVSIPLLDGFSREKRLAVQDTREKESNARARDLDLQIGTEVRTALLDISSGARQQEIAAERLRLAQEELNLARDRFASGVAGNVEVIEAQSALVRARDAEIDARFSAAIARVNLAHATGLIANLH